MNKFLQKSLLASISFSFICLTNNSHLAQAQQFVQMRFVWDFVPSNGAAYFHICTDPHFNINKQTGGCSKFDVLQSNITTNRDKAIVVHRLKQGQSYKACILVYNAFSDKKGLWIDCMDFVARNGGTISLSILRANYVGDFK